MSVSRPRFALSALVVAIVVGGGYALSHHSSAASAAAGAPAVATVDVSQVISRNITDWQSYSGRLEAVDHVDIRPQVSGTLVAVHFKDGSLVKKGDVLFTIDPRPYAAEVERTKAQLAAADARAVFSTANQARSQRLIGDNAISRSDFEQTQSAAREATANQLAAHAALASAQLNLEYTRITAPVSGRVSRAEVTVGNVVAAGGGAKVLTTLVSVAHIYASFDVDEQSFLKYINPSREGKAGPTPVYLGLANEDGYSRLGHVSSVDNSLDTSSGTIRVRADFDNADGILLPGLYARIRLGGGAPHEALLIDEKAVGTDQDKRFVLVVDQNNHSSYREVKLGAPQDGLRVVDTGLKAGERIIVNGLQRVRPGDPVTPNLIPMPGDTTVPAASATATTASATAATAPASPVKAAASSTHTSSKG